MARTIAHPKRGRILFTLALVLALSINFAALEFVLLVVMGFFLARLHCFRFINSALKLTPLG